MPLGHTHWRKWFVKYYLFGEVEATRNTALIGAGDELKPAMEMDEVTGRVQSRKSFELLFESERSPVDLSGIEAVSLQRYMPPPLCIKKLLSLIHATLERQPILFSVCLIEVHVELFEGPLGQAK